MNDFLPARPGPTPGGPEPTTSLDPTLARELEHGRWHVRAAQWRALSLAEWVFGPGVRTTLGPYPGRGPFAGLVHLDVPFTDLGRHRALEALFATLVGDDPVLVCVPLVFSIGPLLAATPGPSHAAIPGPSHPATPEPPHVAT